LAAAKVAKIIFGYSRRPVTLPFHLCLLSIYFLKLLKYRQHGENLLGPAV
jgi:hypothetical protein